MTNNTPYSKEAKDFIAKVYPCEPPCDSYGVCSNCCDEANFGAGYNMGYRAAELQIEELEKRIKELEYIKWKYDNLG